MSYPPSAFHQQHHQHYPQTQTHTSQPLSASSTSSSSSSTLTNSSAAMNGVTTTADGTMTTDDGKMGLGGGANGWYTGQSMNYGGTQGYPGSGPQQQQQQQPQQYQQNFGGGGVQQQRPPQQQQQQQQPGVGFPAQPTPAQQQQQLQQLWRQTAQSQHQFMAPTHPGAMPSIRPTQPQPMQQPSNPSQPPQSQPPPSSSLGLPGLLGSVPTLPTGMNMDALHLHSLQNRMLEQHYKQQSLRMQQGNQPGAVVGGGGGGGGGGQTPAPHPTPIASSTPTGMQAGNLTPFQQQQLMLQYQSHRGAQQHAQIQQQQQHQHQHQQQLPLAPQHSGASQQQQQQQIMPQHTGQSQQGSIAPQTTGGQGQGPGILPQHSGNGAMKPPMGVGVGAGGINPAMLQQNQNQNQQQGFKQPNGTGPMGNLTGSVINPALYQTPAAQSQPTGRGVPPQAAQPPVFQQPQKAPSSEPVPPSPALSTTSNRQSHGPGSMLPPSGPPPSMMQRAPSMSADSPHSVRAMSQTPVSGGPHNQETSPTNAGAMSTHQTPASNNVGLPNGMDVVARPPSQAQNHATQGLVNGWQQQQQQASQAAQNMQMHLPQGMDPRMAMMNRPPGPVGGPGGARPMLPPQQPVGMQRMPSNQSQDGTPRMGMGMGLGAGGMSMSMPPPSTLPPGRESMPPPNTMPPPSMGRTPSMGGLGGPQQQPGQLPPNAQQQMSMIQQAHAARMGQPLQPQGGPVAPQQQRPPQPQMPTVHQALSQLSQAQREHLMTLSEQEQRRQIQVLQMRLMQGMMAQQQHQQQQHHHQQQHLGQTGMPMVGPGSAQRPIAALPPQARAALPQQTPAQMIAAKSDQRYTSISALPRVKDLDDVTHGGALPTLSEFEVRQMKEWIQKDKEYLKLIYDDNERKERVHKEGVAMMGKTPWWEVDEMERCTGGGPGNGVVPGSKLTVLWPDDKRKVRKRKLGRSENRFPLQYNKQEVEAIEELVPIRLEVEYEHYRLRDTFVWNINDPLATVEKFATMTCEDFGLPSHVANLITKQIQEQLLEHKGGDGPQIDMLDLIAPMYQKPAQGLLEDADDAFWERFRKRLRVDTDGDYVRLGEDCVGDAVELKRKEPSVSVKEEESTDKPLDVSKLPQASIKRDTELRVWIKLDIIIGAKQLQDQFEWDVSEPANSAEMFAKVYAQDLGLAKEFETAIAHDIREQVMIYQRALITAGYLFDGEAIHDDDLKQAMLPPVSIAGRSAEQASTSMPILNNLSEGEVEGHEREREKELKRKKRQGRARRNVALPHHEQIKTHRTLPGCVDVSAYLPTPAAVSVPSRRQAAVNASHSIANLVAQENNHGGYISVSHTPSKDNNLLAPPSSVTNQHKSKKQKAGLVAAPALPESVLRPRGRQSANHVGPSTGVTPPPKSKARIAAENEAREIEKAKMPGWHCSTCGCPDAIAVGRRKGPKGDKSQCGPCGKYFHRYRRIKDVVYNPDAEYHLRLRAEENERKRRKRPAKRKPVADDNGLEHSHDATSPVHVDDDDDDDDDDDGPPLAHSRQSPRPKTPPRRVRSPDSSPSPPLAAANSTPSSLSAAPSTVHDNEVKPNIERDPSPSPAPKQVSGPPAPAPPAPSPLQPAAPPPPPPPAPQLPPPSPVARASVHPETPPWLVRSLAALQAAYPDDHFSAIPRPPQPTAPPGTGKEWRIKCFDCPGKVYTPGPEETLTNFEVHLRNRRHKENVVNRLSRERGGAPVS